MKSKEEQIDQIFSTGLANFNEAPSAASWRSLESQLPKNSSKNYWMAASIVAVLMLSVVAWNNILTKSSSFKYDMATSKVEANYPQIELATLPIIIHTTKIVYIEKALENNLSDYQIVVSNKAIPAEVEPALEISTLSNLYVFDTKISNPGSVQLVYNEHEPITITYKKGNPKHPKLAKAANYLKQVRGGDRPLIDFEKISTGLIARRENFNNSNK